jgi:fatty-acyl-CoA synthase
MPASPPVQNLYNYEQLLAGASDSYDWPEFDENTACTLCYTSGTTGKPKGVLYSHRSTVLHALVACSANSLGLTRKDCVLPVVPMFHVNAWGLPYVAFMSGCKLVMPGARLDGASLYALIQSQGVSFAAGVPTIWLDLLKHVQAHGLSFTSLTRTAVGGSAIPVSLIKAYDELGVEVMHGWGMTELSPRGTASRLLGDERSLPKDEQFELVAKQGRAPFSVDMKIVDAAGEDLPWDGVHTGELLVRGHAVVNRYYGGAGQSGTGEADPRTDTDAAFVIDNKGKRWFATGDVARISPQGIMQISDRSKDVIKSGGEWISSIDLENVAMSHPAIAQAAVIAMQHPRWGERPLLIAVKRPGIEIGATGKVQKSILRDRYKNHRLPTGATSQTDKP